MRLADLSYGAPSVLIKSKTPAGKLPGGGWPGSHSLAPAEVPENPRAIPGASFQNSAAISDPQD
jgi:hypothetical protein